MYLALLCLLALLLRYLEVFTSCIYYYLINEYKIQKSKNIRLNITKEKLAQSLGVTRPSLSRELINMKEVGVLEYDRNNILILDLEEIENLLVE